MPKIACQTITFGNARIQGELPEVLEQVRLAGYQGVEIGVRHLKLSECEYYKDLFGQKNLALTALHIGGDFLDVESVAKQRNNLHDVVRFAHAMGVKHILTSGMRHTDTAQLESEAARLAPAGRVCAEEDLTFCYHNHNWEIEDDARGLTYLCDRLPADQMYLALDLGWVVRAGEDPKEMIQRFKERIRYVHIKDVRDGKEWAEVGHGDTDWQGLLPIVQSLGLPWWTTEMDTTTRKPEESIAMSYRYLSQYLGR